MPRRTTAKTSLSDPLRVDFIARDAFPVAGRLGLTIAPGKKDAGRGWDRDPATDLALLRDEYGVSVPVSLMEKHEYAMLGIADLIEQARGAGMTVHWLPILDVSVPRQDQEAAFKQLVGRALAAVQHGETVVVHCRGGLGRSGLFAACVLIAGDVGCEEAIAATRAARPGAIETAQQERWVRRFVPKASAEHGEAKAVPAAVPVQGTRPVPDARPEVTPWLDRVLGTLLGGALGDAIGYPVEFLSTTEEIEARHGRDAPERLNYAGGSLGLVSDDTQMTLFVTDGLIRAAQERLARGTCDPLATDWQALMRWYGTQTGAPADDSLGGWLDRDSRLYAQRAPGMTIMSALGRHARAAPTTASFAQNDSKGCGTVMRAAPFGFLRTRDDAFFAAIDNSRLTHGHPTGALAAGYLAAVVWDLLRGADRLEALAAADALLGAQPDHGETAAAMKKARKVGASGRSLEALGGGWVAEEALAFGVAILVGFDAAQERAIERALWRAAFHGGDSDSTASVAGNLLGAALGASALPARWLAALELRDAIERIGRDAWTAVIRGELVDERDYPPGRMMWAPVPAATDSNRGGGRLA